MVDFLAHGLDSWIFNGFLVLSQTPMGCMFSLNFPFRLCTAELLLSGIIVVTFEYLQNRHTFEKPVKIYN